MALSIQSKITCLEENKEMIDLMSNEGLIKIILGYTGIVIFITICVNILRKLRNKFKVGDRR